MPNSATGVRHHCITKFLGVKIYHFKIFVFEAVETLLLDSV